MKTNSEIINTETKRTLLGKLGTLSTTINRFKDGSSELSQTLTFVGHNGNIHEITSATGDLMLGSPKDLSELETLTVWISENSIRDS